MPIVRLAAAATPASPSRVTVVAKPATRLAKGRAPARRAGAKMGTIEPPSDSNRKATPCVGKADPQRELQVIVTPAPAVNVRLGPIVFDSVRTFARYPEMEAP